jgi:hypothetical protein
MEASSALQGGGVGGGGWLNRHGTAGKHPQSPTSPDLSAPKGGEEQDSAGEEHQTRNPIRTPHPPRVAAAAAGTLAMPWSIFVSIVFT